MKIPVDTNKDCVLAWEAMPDALLGELTIQQGRWLDAHLEECDACRLQFAEQRCLRRVMSRPSDLPIDMESGLQRLLARIDGAAPDVREAPPRRMRLALPALVAAVLVQAIGLGVLGAKVWELESAPAYATLSQPSTPVSEGTIRLVPEPAMASGDLRRLLEAHELRVVGGPNELGAYLVVPRTGRAGEAVLLGKLRATPGILMAEPAADAR